MGKHKNHYNSFLQNHIIQKKKSIQKWITPKYAHFLAFFLGSNYKIDIIRILKKIIKYKMELDLLIFFI